MWRIPVCDDCRLESPTMIMLKNSLWSLIAESKEILCYKCIENRLGRKLTLDDLKFSRMLREGMLIAKVALQSSDREIERFLAYIDKTGEPT